MTDPVLVPCCGQSFERASITMALRSKPRCPLCNAALDAGKLVTNVALRDLIAKQDAVPAAAAPPAAAAAQPMQPASTPRNWHEWREMLRQTYVLFPVTVIVLAPFVPGYFYGIVAGTGALLVGSSSLTLSLLVAVAQLLADMARAIMVCFEAMETVVWLISSSSFWLTWSVVALLLGSAYDMVMVVAPTFVLVIWLYCLYEAAAPHLPPPLRAKLDAGLAANRQHCGKLVAVASRVPNLVRSLRRPSLEALPRPGHRARAYLMLVLSSMYTSRLMYLGVVSLVHLSTSFFAPAAAPVATAEAMPVA